MTCVGGRLLTRQLGFFETPSQNITAFKKKRDADVVNLVNSAEIVPPASCGCQLLNATTQQTRQHVAVHCGGLKA
jgi:hypothetical protein